MCSNYCDDLHTATNFPPNLSPLCPLPPPPFPVPGRKTRLIELFGHWCEAVTDLIKATPEEDVLRRDIYDRIPIMTWSRGRVTLLGDAAHAMQPNLGQGGCMAIEVRQAGGYRVPPCVELKAWFTAGRQLGNIWFGSQPEVGQERCKSFGVLTNCEMLLDLGQGGGCMAIGVYQILPCPCHAM